MRVGPVVFVAFVVACGGHSRRTGGGPEGSGGSGATSAGGSGGAGATGGRGSVAGRSGGSGSPSGGTGGTGVGGSGGRASGGTGAVGGGPDDGGMSNGGAPDERGGTGGTAGRGGSGGTGGTAGNAGSPITSCNDEFPFLGTWEGSILDFYFEPVQALRLEVQQSDGSSDVTGTLTWGDGEPPPPPEDADTPWPPGFWDDRPDLDMGIERGIDPWPGFPYTIVRGAGCDAAFRFGVSTYELFEEWCALQTPVFTPEYGWGCTQQGGGSSNNMTCTVNGETYPLWKCAACGAFGDGVCACDESRCFASTEATRTFDLDYASSSGAEVLSGPDTDCGDCTVRLERTP